MKMAIFNKTTSCTKEQLLKLYKRDNHPLIIFLKYVYGIFRFICIILQNLYCISSYLILSWIVLIPINRLRSDLYSKLENYLYNSLAYIVSSWSLAAGAAIVEVGDDYKHLIEEPERFSSECTRNESKQDNTLLNHDRTSCETVVRDHLSQNGAIDVPTKYKASNLTNGFAGAISSIPSQKNEEERSEISKVLRYSTRNINGHHQDDPNRTQPNGRKISLKKHRSSIESYETPSRDVKDIDRTEYEVASAAGEKELIRPGFPNDGYAPDNNNDLSDDCLIEKGRIENRSSNKIGMKSKTINDQASLGKISKHSSLNQSMVIPAPTNRSLKGVQAKPRILFLCNHISTGDVPLIMQSFSTLTNHSLLWVLDAQFKPTNFGIVCGSHGDFFVAKNSFVDGSLRDTVLKHPDRNLLVLFPEGGFLRKRIDGSNRYAVRNGYQTTKYVTHPRFGAFKDLIDPSVGVTHIVDATLLYDDIEDPLSILDIGLGNRSEPAILHYRLFKRSEINPNEEWLRKIWMEKEDLLKKFYEDRSSFLTKVEHTIRVIRLDWFKILAVHLFYLLVCYLAIFRLFNATSTTMLKARELYYSNM